MYTIRWHPLLTLGMLIVPIAGPAQTAPPQGPQPKITEIATIPGAGLGEFARMPNGRIIVYGHDDSIMAYNLTTKRSTLVTRGWDFDLVISPQGDRIAYSRSSEDGRSNFVWTIPIDPATAAPRGPAQRVTESSGNSPSFSPDGKLIAFDVHRMKGPDDANPDHDLAVVPATGGTQRIVTQYGKQWIGLNSWSADGKWIYVQGGVVPNTAGWIDRVPAAGGTSEHMISYTLKQPMPQGGSGPGDGKIAFYSPDNYAFAQGRLAYATASGVNGEIQVPPRSSPGYLFGPPRAILARETIPSMLRVLDLERGTVRDLPVGELEAQWVTWSPDMKRLAYSSGEGERQELVVTNADGSGQRRYPGKGNGLVGGIRPFWSPDGSNLSYTADSYREIRVLNVATGSSRLIVSAPAQSWFSTVRWQPDGKSLRAMTAVGAPGGPSSKYRVVEIRLDGTQREVRDLSVEFPGMLLAFLVSPQLAIVEMGDRATLVATQIVLVPLNGGSPKPVPFPRLDPGIRLSLINYAMSEQWFFSYLMAANGRVGIQVMSTATDSTRVFRFPANLYAGPSPFIAADGKQIVAFGYERGWGNETTVYSIPLDGSAPHVIGRVPKPEIGVRTSPTTFSATSGFSGLSPDGKYFAFFSPGEPTLHVYDVDLTPILQLIKKP